MSYHNDNDLLDEIKNERNSDSTKASLISLFEGDKNAVFTPSTATSFIGAIISIIIVGTLWWASVDTRLDHLTNTQEKLLTFYQNIKSDVDSNNISIYENLTELEHSIEDLEVSFNNQRELSNTELKQKLLNITTQLTELNNDLRELYSNRNEYELYKLDIQYTIERLTDRLNVLENSTSNGQ